MACSARALQPRPRRRPPPRSLRGLPAGTQLTPQPRKPSSPPPPRPRTEPPPAPPRAQLGQRQPAPPSARPWGRHRPPSRLRGASPAVTQAALPGNFLPCRDHPAPGTSQRGLPPAAGGFLQDWERNPVSALRRSHSHPETPTWRALRRGIRLRLIPPPPLIPNNARKTRGGCARSVDSATAAPPPGMKKQTLTS
nr:serine/arginine repetitive matrix protein 1-like [Chlorocebus sabaeus]